MPTPAPPGSAAAAIETYFGDARVIRIKQWIERAELWLGIETQNRYRVEAGLRSWHAIERRGGLGTMLLRMLLSSHRGLVIDIARPNRDPVLILRRPFYWFFSTMTVQDGDGVPLGTVHRRLAFFWKVYDIKDARGTLLARVRSPPWRFWTFPVEGSRGAPMAVIKKQWGGLFREALTAADRFALELADRPLPATHRALLLATALSIDLDFFSFSRRR